MASVGQLRENLSQGWRCVWLLVCSGAHRDGERIPVWMLNYIARDLVTRANSLKDSIEASDSEAGKESL